MNSSAFQRGLGNGVSASRRPNTGFVERTKEKEDARDGCVCRAHRALNILAQRVSGCGTMTRQADIHGDWDSRPGIGAVEGRGQGEQARGGKGTKEGNKRAHVPPLHWVTKRATRPTKPPVNVNAGSAVR